jgi:hypothetical protein
MRRAFDAAWQADRAGRPFFLTRFHEALGFHARQRHVNGARLMRRLTWPLEPNRSPRQRIEQQRIGGHRESSVVHDWRICLEPVKNYLTC